MADREISKLSVLLLFNTRNFEQKLSEVQRNTKKAAQSMTRAGQQMSLGISLPLAVVGRAIADTATEFEYQMARVQAISGATAQSFSRLQRNAEELGATTIYQATAVGQLQEEYAKLGFTASEITAVTESTLSLAQVTGADLGRAAEIAGSTLRIFGKDVSEVGNVNDIMAVAISQSALDFESFAETMKYAGSQAAISNVSMEEISAAMGVLANRGVKGSIAGTRLRMILAKLAEEGGNTHDKFIELINGTMTMTEAIDRFGVRAASAVPVLQANRDEFFALETSMIQSAGTLQVMQETMDDTAFAVKRRFISALENLSIQFGKVLLPVINFVTEGLINITALFAAMPAPIKGMIVAIASLAVVVGPLLLVFGQLQLVLFELAYIAPIISTAISGLFGPIGLITAAVVGLAVGFGGMLDEGRQVATLSERLADANTEAAEAAGRVLGPLKSLIKEYGNENTTLGRKERILKELMRSQPDYFKNLTTETTNVTDLTEAYDKLAISITKSAKARAVQSQITRVTKEQGELIGKQVKAELEIANIREKQAAGEAGYVPRISPVTGMAFDPVPGLIRIQEGIISESQRTFDNLQSQLMRLQSLFDSERGVAGLLADLEADLGGPIFDGEMGEEISELEKVMQGLDRALNGINKEAEQFGTGGVEIAEKQLSAFTSAFKKLNDLAFEGEDVGENLSYVRGEISRLQDVLADRRGTEAGAEALGSYFTRIDSIIAQYTSGVLTLSEAEEARFTAIKSSLPTLISLLGEEDDMVQSLIQTYLRLKAAQEGATDGQRDSNAVAQAQIAYTRQQVDLVNQFGTALGQAATDSRSFGAGVAAAIRDSVVATLQLAYSRIITSALDPSNPANQASFGLAGLGAAAVGMGILTGLIQGIQIPAFAQGGIVSGAQLAMVGDNRSGKEAIIPLEKLPYLMSQMGGLGGTRVYGQLSGYDLAISSERGGKRFQRISH